jgi:hypothetical protein
MIRGLVTRFAAGLRFPTLFAVMAGLFVLDLLVPDLIPFADEILLALGTLFVGSLRRRAVPAPAGSPGTQQNQ